MAPGVFAEHLRSQGSVIREKRALQVAHRKRVDQYDARADRENRQILSEVLLQHAGLSEADVELLEIPSGYSETSALTDDRIREYTEHLQKMVREAVDALNAPSDEKVLPEGRDFELCFSEDSDVQAISDRLCGMCKGGCCTRGGNTSYLSESTISRFMNDHPELSAPEIVQRYLSKLAPKTLTGACINQTKAGCALPREMRSDGCSTFYCDPLATWHEQPPDQRKTTVLAIQRRESYWVQLDLDSPDSIVNVALVHAEGTVRNLGNLTRNVRSGNEDGSGR